MEFDKALRQAKMFGTLAASKFGLFNWYNWICLVSHVAEMTSSFGIESIGHMSLCQSGLNRN